MESSQEEFLRLLDPSFYNSALEQGDSFGAVGPAVNGVSFLDANANDVDDLFKWQTIDFNFPPATDVTTTTTFNPSNISAGSVNPVPSVPSAGKALKASRADFDFTTTGQDSSVAVSTSAVNDNDVQEVKRKRNCEASARFRQKKKQREQESELKMKELLARNEYLEMRVVQLEQETKWLRGLLLEKIPTAPTTSVPTNSAPIADLPGATLFNTEIASGTQNPLSKVKAGLVSLLDFGNVQEPCELLLLKDLETLLNDEQAGAGADLKCYSLCFKIYKNISALENYLNNDDLLQAAKTSYELREQFEELATLEHNIDHITGPLYEYFSESEAYLKHGIDQIARALFQVERSFGHGSFDLRVPRDIQINLCGRRVHVQSKQVGSILMEYRLNNVFEDIIHTMLEIALKPLVKRQIVIEKVVKGGPFLCCLEFRKPSDNVNAVELPDGVVKFAQAISELLLSSAEVKSQFGKEIRPILEELLMKECFYEEVPDSFTSDDFEAYRQTLMKPFFDFERQIASCGWIGQNYASRLSDQVIDIFFEKRKEFIKDAVETVLNHGDQNLVRFDPASLCTENEKLGKSKPTSGKGKNGGLKELQSIMKACRVISSTSLIMDMVQEQILLGLDYFNHPNKSLSYRFFLLARLVVDHWVAFLLKGKMDCFRSNLMNKCAVYTDSMHGVYRLAKIDAMVVKTGKFPLNSEGNSVPSVFADLYPFVLRQGEQSLEQGIAEIMKRIEGAFDDRTTDFTPEQVSQVCEESYKTFKYMLSEDDSSKSIGLLIEMSASLLVDRYKHAASNQEKLQLKFFMINFKTRWMNELLKISSTLNDLNVNELARLVSVFESTSNVLVTTFNSHPMSESKLQKLLAINERLKQEESLERILVSKASKNLVDYTKSIQDPLVKPSQDNPFSKKAKSGGCVLI